MCNPPVTTGSQFRYRGHVAAGQDRVVAAVEKTIRSVSLPYSTLDTHHCQRLRLFLVYPDNTGRQENKHDFKRLMNRVWSLSFEDTVVSMILVLTTTYTIHSGSGVHLWTIVLHVRTKSLSHAPWNRINTLVFGIYDYHDRNGIPLTSITPSRCIH